MRGSDRRMSTASHAGGQDVGRINVLLIGSGGREHALAWKISQSPRLGTLYATGCDNPGIAALAQPVPSDVPINPKDSFQLRQYCARQQIRLVVVGPEDPLAAGLVDALAEPYGMEKYVPAVFGPTRAGAMLEADKAWAKEMMRAAAIPTGEARTFIDAEAAKGYVESRVRGDLAFDKLMAGASAYTDSQQRRMWLQQQVDKSREIAGLYTQARADLPVIKAAGLAKGKGVFLPGNLAEAMDAINRIMVRREFGEAGRAVVIEERLRGREVSVFAVTDGRSIVILDPCQDHKRLGEGAKGPNTGGMGALCPTPALDAATAAKVEREVLLPTVDVLGREGIDYRGVVYAGLMLTPSGPKVLEYNTRFGDPECQVLMVRFAGDILPLLLAAAERKLDKYVPEPVAEGAVPGAAVTVILAASGYPDNPRKGDVITGLEEAGKVEGVVVFHAGTKRNERGEIVTNGGRVLAVTAAGADREEARRGAYAAAERIHFAGKVWRGDIGTDVVG